MTQLIRRLTVVAASAAALTMICGLPLIAQESKAPQTETQTRAKTARRAYDPARRVPPFFGQLGLSAEQKEEIYKIQGQHMPKIESLEKQIEELRAQMLRECEGVLTSPQKQVLDQRRAGAAATKSKRSSTAKPQP
jgi:hypothetical protein